MNDTEQHGPNVIGCCPCEKGVLEYKHGNKTRAIYKCSECSQMAMLECKSDGSYQTSIIIKDEEGD